MPRINSQHIFSVDIKEIRSYTYNDPQNSKFYNLSYKIFLGNAWVKFIVKDGTTSDIYHFYEGGYSSFVDCLQR